MSTRKVIRAGLIRAYRVFVYAFVGSTVVANIGPVRSLADLRIIGSAWAFSAVTAGGSALVAFLVATAESVNGVIVLPGPKPSNPRDVT